MAIIKGHEGRFEFGIRHCEVDEMMEKVSRAARLRGQIEGAGIIIVLVVVMAYLTFPEWRSLLCL
jgi:hypothetical protein